MTISKTQQNKMLHDAVKAVLVDGENEDTVLDALGEKGIAYSVLNKFTSHKATIGKKEGWILSPEQIVEKVKKHLAGAKPNHYLDVIELADKISLGNLTSSEKQEYIISVSGVDASKVEESAQLKRLHNPTTRYGCIYDWVWENPEFTPEQIKNSGLNMDCKNREDYNEEFIANRIFFFKLYEKVNNISNK